MSLSTKRPSRGDDTRQRLLDEVADTKQKKKRLNAEVEASLHKRIKIKSAEEGRSISDITRDLWLEYLSR